MAKGRFFVSLLTVASMMGLYQNCSQSQFSGTAAAADSKPTGDFGDAVFGTEPDGSAEGSVLGDGDSDSGSDSDSSEGTVAGGRGSSGGGTCSDETKKRGKSAEANETSSQDSASGLMECMLGGPSQKIVVATGNAEAVHGHGGRKVCMSANACLVLINAYAADRGCALTTGPASLPGSTQQCTARFPGSQGTCKNASVISDAEVSALLDKMASM